MWNSISRVVTWDTGNLSPVHSAWLKTWAWNSNIYYLFKAHVKNVWANFSDILTSDVIILVYFHLIRHWKMSAKQHCEVSVYQYASEQEGFLSPAWAVLHMSLLCHSSSLKYPIAENLQISYFVTRKMQKLWFSFLGSFIWQFSIKSFWLNSSFHLMFLLRFPKIYLAFHHKSGTGIQDREA